MIKRIAHIGVAVKDIGLSKELFSRLFDYSSVKSENVPQQKATIAFYPIGESSVELIESTDPSSSLRKFVDKRGEGIHHICLEVDNLKEEIVRLKKLGFQFVNDGPSDGGDGYKIAFLHPNSTNGVLIELSEKIIPSPKAR